MFAFALFAFAGSAFAATNLISNPGFEDAETQSHWSFGFAPTASSSIIAGENGGSAAHIELTSAIVGGDAKWVHDIVPVVAGALYTFSDSYKSTAATSLVVGLSGGVDGQHPDVYIPLATLPSTGGVWAQTTQQFTPYLGYTTATVYHTISAAGSLTTDNYALLETASSSQNLFSQGIVSLTFDDGWTSQYTNAFPLLSGLKATFYLVGKALANASIHDLFTDPNATVEMQTLVAPTSVTWSPLYTDPSIQTYEFTDNYSASTTSTVEVTYSTGNHTATTTLIFPSPSTTFPAGNNLVAQFALVLPASFDPGITIKHISAGNLTVASRSLVSDLTGYMTPAMMLELQNAGNEIGGHTESHCNLVRIFDGLPSTSVDNCAFPEANLTYTGEITNGYNSIVNRGATNVFNFAYPNGATNETIKSYIKNNTNFVSARTVDDGYNTQQSDKMALKVQVIDTDISIATIKGWIDTAVANQTWLILVFHQVDNPAAPSSHGEDGGTTTDVFSQIVAYLKEKPVNTVKTVAEALAMMTANPVPVPTLDTTVPVITLTGSASTSVTVGTTYSDAGATATDNVDPSVAVVTTVTVGAVATTSVNTNVIGTYVVHYNAHDTAGNNAAEVTRTVNVIEVPVVPAPVLSAEQQGTVTDTSVTITWTTDHAATSRVVWGTTSVLTASTTEAGAPNYGYANSATEDATLTTSHSVTVSGLSANTTYYFRPVSHGSPETVGNEVTVTTATTPVTPPSTPAPAGGNGGGGGGGGVSGTGPLSLGYVYVNPVGPVTTTPGTGGSVLGAATCFVFTKNLTVGSTGSELTALQNRLTAEGLFTAGATGYFGSVTKASVMAYQKKNSIDALGNTGPKTRAALNATCTTAPVLPTTPATGSVLGSSTFVFTQNLSLGSTGEEVNELQKVLIGLGFLKIAAPTGYFGALTKVGVSDYQISRGIQAVGSVGPKTRAALNSNAAAVSTEK
jgi:peptidoglycan hydrolase-like protein with peptidoglycan-binding domain/peptidoglycan/xylan/chitin deacetylase (PgdA/CDA1 family)